MTRIYFHLGVQFDGRESRLYSVRNDQTRAGVIYMTYKKCAHLDASAGCGSVAELVLARWEMAAGQAERPIQGNKAESSAAVLAKPP